MDLKHLKKQAEEYQAKSKEIMAVVHANNNAKEEFGAYCNRLQLQKDSCMGPNSNFDFASLKKLGALDHFKALLDLIRQVQDQQEKERKERSQRLKRQKLQQQQYRQQNQVPQQQQQHVQPQQQEKACKEVDEFGYSESEWQQADFEKIQNEVSPTPTHAPNSASAPTPTSAGIVAAGGDGAGTAAAAGGAAAGGGAAGAAGAAGAGGGGTNAASAAALSTPAKRQRQI